MPVVRVKSNPKLVRDQATSAILNTDNRGLAEYRLRRAARLTELQKKNELRADVDELTSRVGSIQSTLNEILSLLKPDK